MNSKQGIVPSKGVHPKSFHRCGMNLDCTDDADIDSADEVAGLPNDAYNPPICLQTTLRGTY